MAPKAYPFHFVGHMRMPAIAPLSPAGVDSAMPERRCVRCHGVTKSGQRCSITSRSQMLDASGRRVALPLCHGGSYCMIHTVLFLTRPAQPSDATLIAYIDLETSSLDPLGGSIVEIGSLICDSGSVFSTVVKPRRSLPADPCAVHGISHNELLQGPSFATAFGRFARFLDFASLSVPEEADSDSDDARSPSRSMAQGVDVALVAHNGRAFDFPFLASACLRTGVGISSMAQWSYVDTLDLLRAAGAGGLSWSRSLFCEQRNLWLCPPLCILSIKCVASSVSCARPSLVFSYATSCPATIARKE